MASMDNSRSVQSGASSSSEMDGSVNTSTIEIHLRTESSNPILVNAPDPKGKGTNAGAGADHMGEDGNLNQQEQEPQRNPNLVPGQQNEEDPPLHNQREEDLPRLEVHKYHCIPEGKWFRYTVIPTIFLFLASIGLLVLLLVVVVFEVNTHKTHEIPKGAIQAMKLNDILPYSNLLSEKICISDLDPTPLVTVALAQGKCSQVEYSFYNEEVAGYEKTDLTQGLLFYWLNETVFHLDISIQNGDSVYVRLQKSTNNGKEDLRGSCLEKKGRPVFEWTIQEDSCNNTGGCSYTNHGYVNESNYYYLCFDGDTTSFDLGLHLHRYNDSSMIINETCGAKDCCMSYSNLFTELNHESSTCVFLLTSITDSLPLNYLRKEVTKISITTKIGARWWVFAVLSFLTVVTMIATGVLCHLCTFSGGRHKNARVCRHVFTCSCHRIQYRVIEGY